MCRRVLIALLILLLPAWPAKTEGGTKMAYVYKDKYGITHVTESEETAQQYGGGIYASYSGGHSGGYATDKEAAEKAYQSAISGGGGYTPTKTTTSSYGGGYSTGTYSPSNAAAEALQRAAGHVQYFGSPQAYAKAIQEKGMANLTDPEAARAFMQANPQLFGGGGTATTTKGLEIPNLYAIPPASGPMAEIMRESSTHPVAQAAAQAFYQYLHGQAGQTGVTPEQAYQRAAEATYQNVLGGMSYPQAKQAFDQMMMQYQLQQMQPMQQMQAQIAPLIEQLQREIQNVNAETAPVVMNAYNQVIGMIDRVQQDLFSRFEQLGQGVDPATQAALASLKETVRRQRENLMEDLSRRGLLQSGIWLEMEDRLNKGLLTEQQRLLATRLSDLQNQLNQALVSLGEMRIRATQQFGAEQIRQMEAAAQRRQQAIEALTNAALKIQEQIAEQQRWEQEQAWERQKYFIPSWVQQAQYTGVIPPLYPGDPSAAIRQAQKEWGEAYARGDEEGMKRAHEKAEALRAAAGWPSGGESGLLTEHLMTPAGLPTAEMQRAWWPYQYPRAGELLPYELGPTPAQMLPYQYPTANALLPYTQGPTPYEQARLNLERQRLAQAAANAAARAAGGRQRAAGGRQPTLTERRQATLADAYDAIDAAINQGHTVEDIEASIDSQYSDLVRQGIDPAKLKQYLRDRAISGAVSYRKTPKELETERLKSRPFWQKAIDFILPFGQYR